MSLSVSEPLEQAIQKSIKDFKATLTIQNLELIRIEENYNINHMELELEEK